MILEIADFGRVTLAQLIHELNMQTGVEVGVAEGWYSNEIMKVNPQLKLYGVDPYSGYKGYSDYTKATTFDRLETNAHAALDKYWNYEFIRKTSMEAVVDFSDNSLDFVYIDANHADPYVTQDITEWYNKVRPGGILAGHDYTRTKGGPNDTRAATAAFSKKMGTPLFILGTDIMREGEVRDQPRSWMMIK